MAKQFPKLDPLHREFILRQRMFFTASAASDGRVNVSPKGLDTLRIVDDRCVVYLDLTGSGNETSAHLKRDGRLTLMFCSLEGAPLILRLYGRGRIVARGSPDYARYIDDAFSGNETAGARHIVRLDIDLVQTSCGFGVPLFEYSGERPALVQWAAKLGPEGLEAYRLEKNIRSIDGCPTGMLED